MQNPFKRHLRKKEKSEIPSPSWSDEELLKAMGSHVSTSIQEATQNALATFRDQAQQALFAKYQRKTVRWAIVACVVAALAVAAAIWVPIYQHDQEVQSELSSLYGTIDANGDIFVTNADNLRYFEASDKIANLPDAYIDYAVPDDLQQPLQLKLGMVNYTFLLYYEEETTLLNQTRDDLNTSLITEGASSPEYKNAKKIYVATMNYLSEGGWDQTKFNYVTDPGCLLYLLQTGFNDSIPASKFDKVITCSNDSLNRIFYWFGYLPPLTPAWMNPLLQNALNQRQAGMGDQTIQMDAHE